MLVVAALVAAIQALLIQVRVRVKTQHLSIMRLMKMAMFLLLMAVMKMDFGTKMVFGMVTGKELAI